MTAASGRIGSDAPLLDRRKRPARIRTESAGPFVRASVASAVLLVIASWVFMALDGGGFGRLVSGDAWARAWGLIRSLTGLGGQGGNVLSDLARWREAISFARDSLVMGVIAAGLAASLVLVTVAFAASNLTHGELSVGDRPSGRVLFGATRAIYLFTRSIPELAWAMIIIFVVSPGIYAGALALALHNFGVLGRLGAEVIEDLDPRPIQALRTAGASNLKVLLYGVLPQTFPQLITFLMYRSEVIIRTTAVVGFAAAAGLGYHLKLDLSLFKYSDAGLLLAVYVLLVWAVDAASGVARRLAR